jgi:hypothetical protein
MILPAAIDLDHHSLCTPEIQNLGDIWAQDVSDSSLCELAATVVILPWIKLPAMMIILLQWSLDP